MHMRPKAIPAVHCIPELAALLSQAVNMRPNRMLRRQLNGYSAESDHKKKP